jgi:mono/diheme cytochrome c family protein
MQITIPVKLILLPILALAPLAGTDETLKIKRISAHSTTAIGGQEVYREYCAVCHGGDAKGNGPAAAALKAKPTDLTQISRKNEGKYPEVRVQRVINGEDDVFAHGSRDMPIWGQVFRQGQPDRGQLRIYNLVKYIEQIQEK